MFRVPGIAADWSDHAIRELVGVGLSDHYHPGGKKPLNRYCVDIRDMAGSYFEPDAEGTPAVS
jgi:hypothetical protein